VKFHRAMYVFFSDILCFFLVVIKDQFKEAVEMVLGNTLTFKHNKVDVYNDDLFLCFINTLTIDNGYGSNVLCFIESSSIYQRSVSGKC
jgi:hypothetical protein